MVGREIAPAPVRPDVTKKTKVVPLYVCDPRDDRCVEPPMNPPFSPGIAVKHSPSCTGAICHLFSCDGGNWRMTREGTLDRSEWIKGWAMTQLLTRGFVDCPEHPLGQRGGGWWADAFRMGEAATRFRSGSKLWALQWLHGGATSDVLLFAKQYAAQALQPLQSWAIVSRIQIDAFYIAAGPLMGRHDRTLVQGAAIQLAVKLFGPGVSTSFDVEGRQQPNAEWLWREYFPPKATPPIPGRYYVRAG